MVIAALAVMLWRSLQQPTDSGGETVRARGVGQVANWSLSPMPPVGIHVQLDSVPNERDRAWLGALSGAGTRVTWSGDITAVMIDAQPVASPTGGTRVLAASPRSGSIVISDDVGPIDTVKSQLSGAILATGSVAGHLRATVGGSLASTIQRDSLTLRKVLVIGSAGWESKFVVAALEEDGWKVDTFIRVAPGVDVTQGSAAVIDTSRYSAIIALDGAALPYASRIIEFARTGGGVVLTSQSASIDGLSPLRAGAVGRANAAPRPVQASGSVTLATLQFAPIVSLRADAVLLERRGGSVTTAARRNGAGRSIQHGYEDTWRWRMDGGEGTARDHRMWWTEVVSSVANAPPVPREPRIHSSDEAPVIGLVDAIGSGTQAGSMARLSGDPSDWMAWLFVLLALGLIVEVASRRMRGAR